MEKETQKMSWVALRHAIAKQSGVTDKEANAFLTALTEQISNTLKQGESVKISGLGTFKMQEVAARKSVNILTGEAIVIDSYNKINFTAETSLVQRVNLQPTLLPGNDPMQKLSEQADEILDILADLGQGPRTEQAEEPKEEKEVKKKESKPKKPKQAKMPEVAEVAEAAERINMAEGTEGIERIEGIEGIEGTERIERIEAIEAIEGIEKEEEEIYEEPVEALPIISIESPERKEEKPFRPWLVAIITMVVFAVLLLGLYIFMQNKIESWLNTIHERVEMVETVEEQTTETEIATEIETETIADTLSLTEEEEEVERIEGIEEIEGIEKDEEVEEVSITAERQYTEWIAEERLPAGSRLAWLAKKYYGNSHLWVFIYEANKENIKRPSQITEGTLVRVPKLDERLKDMSNPELAEMVYRMEKEFLEK